MYEVHTFNIFSTRIVGASERTSPTSYLVVNLKLSQQDRIAPVCYKRGRFKTGNETSLTFLLRKVTM